MSATVLLKGDGTRIRIKTTAPGGSVRVLRRGKVTSVPLRKTHRLPFVVNTSQA